jgi:hypothetical protein
MVCLPPKFLYVLSADRMQQEVWRMSEELRQQTEAMVLKDGCISLLRDRLRTVRTCGLFQVKSIILGGIWYLSHKESDRL